MLDPQTRWTRRKLQSLLVAGVVVLCALVAGSVWAVAALLSPSEEAPTATSPVGHSTASSPEDDLAERPLPAASLEEARPGQLATTQVEAMKVPAASTTGPAAVASGFPHTAEGALAQLAAINRAAFTSASVRTAQEIIEAWALEGGPDAESWSGAQALATLLSSAGVQAEAQNSLSITMEPTMGFIKGQVGENFVVPCIDYVLSVAMPGGPAREVAAADCQRMQWVKEGKSGRWLIGTGEEPAPAPSLWPGTQASFDAGYLWLEVER